MCLTGCERLSLEVRFLSKLEQMPNGCRVWRGALSRGGNRPHSSPYGSISTNACFNSVRAHVAAAYLSGLISDLRVPPGMNLDHTCEQHGTLCVDCLELVTAQENLARIKSRPIPKTDVPYRTKTKKRPARRKRLSSNLQKTSLAAKK